MIMKELLPLKVYPFNLIHVGKKNVFLIVVVHSYNILYVVSYNMYIKLT